MTKVETLCTGKVLFNAEINIFTCKITYKDLLINSLACRKNDKVLLKDHAF